MRFFANAIWPAELQKRADELNKTQGINKVHEGGEIMNDKMSQGIPREGYNPIPEKGSMNPRPPIPPLPLPKLGAQPGNQNAKIPFPEFNKDWTPAQMEIWFKFRKEEIVR